MSATASDRIQRSWNLRTALIAFALQTALSAAFAGDAPQPGGRLGLERGVEAYWNADYEKARAELASVVETGLAVPDRVSLHKFLALCAFAQGRDSDVMRQLELILEIDPTYRFGTDEVAPPVRQAFDLALDKALKDAYARGKSLYVAGRRREAAEAFEKASKLDPTDDYARVFLALATNGLAGGHSPTP
jgi:tetratricopeptide (TPR) repeat protein